MGHDHDHDRTVKPMVDEITDFEVLEIALRELCIEKGIFTAEEHRRFTEFAEQIGPTPAARIVSASRACSSAKNWAISPANRCFAASLNPPYCSARRCSPFSFSWRVKSGGPRAARFRERAS